jgi:hypothetical protein
MLTEQTNTQKIIFIDAFGTLMNKAQSDESFFSLVSIDQKTGAGKKPTPAEIRAMPKHIDQDTVDMVQGLLKRHNAKLVLIGNSRGNLPESTLTELCRHGFNPGDFHIDWSTDVALLNEYNKTTCDQRKRHLHQWSSMQNGEKRSPRVLIWLTLHPEVDNFVILDKYVVHDWVSCTPQQTAMHGLKCQALREYENPYTGRHHDRSVHVPNYFSKLTAAHIENAEAVLSKPVSPCIWL